MGPYIAWGALPWNLYIRTLSCLHFNNYTPSINQVEKQSIEAIKKWWSEDEILLEDDIEYQAIMDIKNFCGQTIVDIPLEQERFLLPWSTIFNIQSFKDTIMG